MSLYAALLAPLAWRIPGHAARMLHRFARAELGSAIDLQIAANRTSSTERRALYLRHAADEMRHALMFTRRSAELLRARGEDPLGDPTADTLGLYERLGEEGFLAFVHMGEARACRELSRHQRTCERLGDDKSATMIRTILSDEERHASYTRAELAGLAGGDRGARRAILRATLWENVQRFRRMGRASAGLVYVVVMAALYVVSAPLAIFARRALPKQRGWTGS